MLKNPLKTLLAPPAVEQRCIELAGKSIEYTLKRTNRRRSIGLLVDERGLTVAVPRRTSEKWLKSVLQEKAPWVINKLESWQARPVQRWGEGAEILFRGEVFLLRLVPSLFDAPPQVSGKFLVVHTATPLDAQRIEKSVERWYREAALQLLNECVEHFSALMKVAPREIRLSNARTQWGSCTAQGVVRFNWHLVKLPLELVDYVVVHELAHLVELNHSAAFWCVVEGACPDYVKLRRQLRGHKFPAAGA